LIYENYIEKFSNIIVNGNTKNAIKLKKCLNKKNNIKEEKKELNYIIQKIKIINSFSINDDIEDYLPKKRFYKLNSSFVSDILKNIAYKNFC
jgi:hypothetical protein